MIRSTPKELITRMLRKLSTEKNSDNTARITITGYLVEAQVVQTTFDPDAFEVRMIDKETGDDQVVTTTTDFDGAVTLAEESLRELALAEQLDGIESLDSDSD